MPCVGGCFLSAPIARMFAQILSSGSQTTYSRMKVEMVGGGERMWQGLMSRAMRPKNDERRWRHWVRRILLPFTLGNLGFSRSAIPCAAERYRAGNLARHLARLLARAANDAGNRPPVSVNLTQRFTVLRP